MTLSACGSDDEPETAAGPPPGGGGPPPASVRVGEVQVRTLQHRVPVIGRLQEVRRVTVTAEVEGKILELSVDEGVRVTGGETTLARIDQTWAELSLKAAEGAVAETQATLTQAQSDAQQLEQLLSAGSARDKEAQDARTMVAATQARLDQAIAQRDRAKIQRDRALVIAPFDGAVSRKLVEAGQWVDPGDGIIELISVGEIDALVDVPERLVVGLAVGDEVRISIEALGLTPVGKIVSIRPDGSNASRTFPVKIRISDLDAKLKAGMSITAEIPVSQNGEFITVPRAAVLYNATGADVWYAAEMGGPLPAALPEPVEVLFGLEDRYVVRPLPGGQGPALTDGTRVVIEGAERLFPTRPLQILAEGPPPVTGESGPARTSDEPAAPRAPAVADDSSADSSTPADR